MPLLDQKTIQQRLNDVPEWKLTGKEIVREFQFADFAQALRFVNAVGEKAEAAAHHPDIDIRYNKVRLALTSHDAGGLTENDFQLASEADAISSKN